MAIKTMGHGQTVRHITLMSVQVWYLPDTRVSELRELDGHGVGGQLQQRELSLGTL
jgi:hypothetical protein